jgi:tetratricopeptide (TPR) repeat protein
MALSLNPDHPDVYQNLAAACFFNKDYQAAIDIARKGLVKDPHNAHLHGNIGFCELDMDNYPSAIESFQKCLKESPGNLDALVGLSLAYYSQGDRDSSRKYLQMARKTEPLLEKGMAGLAELAKYGVSYTDKETEIFNRMFTDLK